MGLCGHCLSSNSFLETERENTWFLYKKASSNSKLSSQRIIGKIEASGCI
jgi:hypothetical protein